VASASSPEAGSAAVDELIVLAGGNPLPIVLAVAARQPTTLHVLHTAQTAHVTPRLAREDGPITAAAPDDEDRHRVHQVVGHRVDGSDGATPTGQSPPDHSRTRDTVARLVATATRAGRRIGLDYTGGTKLMSVAAATGLPDAATRSYITHARTTGEVRFDDGPRVPLGEAHFPTFDAIAALHGFQRHHRPAADRAAPNEWAQIFQDTFQQFQLEGTLEELRESLTRGCAETFRAGVKPNLPYQPQLPDPGDVADAKWLASFEDLAARYRLNELADELAAPVPKLVELAGAVRPHLDQLDQAQRAAVLEGLHEAARILTGGWLEHYVATTLLPGAARNVELQPMVEANDVVAHPAFELDVVYCCGDRLNVVSCTTSNAFGECWQKGAEALYRAEQLGGALSKAALVCTAEDAEVERLAAALADDTGLRRGVRVYGASRLRRWIGGHDTGDLWNWAREHEAG
jgi:hypothetical protein